MLKKKYQHKLNSFDLGQKIFAGILVAAVISAIFILLGWTKVGYLLLALAITALVILIMVINYELHQDKIMNRKAIKAESIFEAAKKKKSFEIYYRNGSVWCEHLDGLYDREDVVIEKFKKDLETIRKESTSGRIVIILDETIVNSKILTTIVDSFSSMNKRIQRLVLVGLTKKEIKMFEQIKKGKIDWIAINYENDLEKAKEWVIS